MQQLDLFNKDNDKIAVFRPKKKQPDTKTEVAPVVEMPPEAQKEDVVIAKEEQPELVVEEQTEVKEDSTYTIEEEPEIIAETITSDIKEQTKAEESIINAIEEEPVIEEEKIIPVIEKRVEPKQVQLIKPLSKKIEEPAKRGRKSLKEINLDVSLLEIPDDETLAQKQYYSITEVAEWFNMKASLLRFWENEFDILKPRKNKKGDRLFRPEDIKNLRLIYYLLRQQKYSVEGARQFLKDNRKKAEMQVQLVESLTKFRSFLLELRANLGT